jgi:hypothetical protein
MRKKLFVVCCVIALFLGCIQSVGAQTVCGKIVTVERHPIEFANVEILNSSDSSLLEGTYSSGLGTFLIEKVPYDKLLLKISFLGYQTKFMEIEPNASSTDLGEIILSEDVGLLSEVVVSASVPPFSRKGNSLIANVSASRLSSVGTANDVLKNIPGITLKGNAITVFGKGAPVIYINNRKLYDTQELQSLQSSDIATVEMIANPGARYDADGRAVLIIKTQKNEENGWAFKVLGELKQGKYFGNRDDAGITYQHDNLSLFASYNLLSNKTYQQPELVYANLRDTLWQQFMTLPQMYKSLSPQLAVGFDWSVTKNQAIGGQYQGKFSHEKIKTDGGLEEIWANSELYDRISTELDSREKSSRHLVNAFYRGDYNNSFGVRLDIDYVQTNGRTDQVVNESSPMENRRVTLNIQTDFKLYAAKPVVVYRFGKNSQLEGGAEYSRIEGSGFVINPEQFLSDNIYTNREEKTAGFVSYNNRFGKLDFQAGIRYEWVYAKSTEDSIRQTKIDRFYRGFYPNLSLSQSIGETQMGLAFSRKTRRPTFSEYNYNYYINRFLLEKGNPYLQNEVIYQADYSLKYKVFDFQLGYVYTKNPIGFGYENAENNSSQIIMKNVNYSKYQMVNALLTTEFEYKIWRPRITGGLNQPLFSVTYLGNELKRNQLSFSFQFFNDLVFPKEFIFSANFIYEGKSYSYMAEIGEYKTLELGLRKSFFDKKLSFNLQAYDIFGWIKDSVKMETGNISYAKQTKIHETRYGTLTVSYHFNNYKKKYRGEDAVNEDIKRL